MALYIPVFQITYILYIFDRIDFNEDYNSIGPYYWRFHGLDEGFMNL